ncbi:MAG: 30S ribosomal protein S7 [Patescibacteria group bacterium]
MRSKTAKTRQTLPDEKYKSTRIAKLINLSMYDGKKSVAQKQIYDALELLEKKFNKKGTEVFDEVIQKVMPQMEVRSRRVGGAAYQVPMPVRGRRGFSLAVRWLIESARGRSNSTYHTFAEKFVAELEAALNNEGGAIEKRNTSHRMADANRAFAHFRW